jgi:hypothetical protein
MTFLLINADQSGLLEQGDEIGIFDGELCVGAYVFDNETFIGMSTGTDDPLTVWKDGFEEQKEIGVQLWKRNTDKQYRLTFESSMGAPKEFTSFGHEILDMTRVSSMQELGDRLSAQLYPNPTKGSFTIDLYNPEDGNVEILIVDELGRPIVRLLDAPMNKGFHKLELNAKSNVDIDIANGLYMLIIRAKGDQYVKRMVIQQ